ncbi:pentapeptide repeat-containing protein [Arthrobacter sp. zg-Y877]|uniref:pentapeptide repeat-containing protein n=1 Tax=Arthrobacter sp. zg-Y877 TaxID=3049074 RepID=UPI0025A32F99|nr:pentapeptide repeat-containing protein [Arthrobacter sp. zg-Y877]MDM7991511.1 pentapeptide repeat-containing protein [Arthrobacter sp. zg-Y877]
MASAIVVGILSYLLASWYLGTWNPFENGQDLPWEALGRLAIPLTALLAAIVGAVIAGHGQSAKLRELKNAEDANVTARFTSSLDQLASDNENVRIGGIYALERIGHDSERDRKTIVSILRTNLFRPDPLPSFGISVTSSTSGPPPNHRLTEEVKKALGIALMRLRRPDERDELESYLIQDLNIEGADLGGAYLAKRHFTKVFLAETSFRGSDCRKANFFKAIAFRADFSRALLQGSIFHYTELIEANFRFANLRNADFAGADLQGVDLRGANIRDAKLTVEQLQSLQKPLNKWQARARGVEIVNPSAWETLAKSSEEKQEA